MSDGSSVLAFDVGGTHLRGALVDAEGRLLRRQTRESPVGDGAALQRALAGLGKELQRGADPRPSAAALAIAGVLDVRRGWLAASPNLRLRELPLGEPLSAALSLPVRLVNDVNAAAAGEAWAAGSDDLVVLLVGTGVGTGAVAGGRLVEGARGMALEGGHAIFRPGGPLCPMGCRGCYESYLGGASLARHAAAAGVGHDAATLVASWRAGSPAAARIVESAMEALAGLVTALVTFFDPERIVLGGGVLEGLPELRAAATRAIADHPLGAGRRDIAIDAPRLGDDAGLRGAAVVAGLVPG